MGPYIAELLTKIFSKKLPRRNRSVSVVVFCAAHTLFEDPYFLDVLQSTLKCVLPSQYAFTEVPQLPS